MGARGDNPVQRVCSEVGRYVYQFEATRIDRVQVRRHESEGLPRVRGVFTRSGGVR